MNYNQAYGQVGKKIVKLPSRERRQVIIYAAIHQGQVKSLPVLPQADR
jgi:hypothetical protein